MSKQPEPQKTDWHHLIGALLEALLTPMGISVQVDIPVMSKPPEADIILLRRKGSHWTEEQKAYLPDGIRDSKAAHILIEFKYSESMNEDAIHQALAYNFFYRKAQKLKKSELQTFLMISKTPKEPTLTKFDWQPTQHTGIYKSGNSALNPLKLILLNEISSEAHNAWVKCFASQKKEKISAFSTLNNVDLEKFSYELYRLVQGFPEIFDIGDFSMKEAPTPEKVMEMGRKFQNIFLAGLEPEERMRGLTLEERLKGFSPEEIKAYLKKLERMTEQ